jgi:carbon monoxide dehydrogenase subunit G
VDFGGRYLFGAKRVAVWAALNDTDVLQAVIPGCERIAWTGPETLDLSIKVNLGLMKPVFDGELLLSDVRPAELYTLSGRGKGGMLGMAQASAVISLADAGELETILAFDGFFEAIGREMAASVTALPRVVA